MTGELFINNIDAYSQWGVSLADGSLTALMSPSATKGYVTNESAAAHGTQVWRTGFTPKLAERDIQLTLHLQAADLNSFLSKYSSFIAVLQAGFINIRTSHQPSVTYKCLYQSCQQFSQYNGRLAKFVLKLTEPNPNDRN